ncbi:uncharacterized protein LOC117610397 [Osmia lignaria lignaria]|uniref:uncharacterized protein LOC117610397 n=1 Tax=Osmia lignaria lignaria TaxID=1437193 RepID=UPI00402BC48B
MSTSTSTYIEQQVTNVIKRFKFEEMESSVMPIFPEISWTNVKSQLVKCHKTFTSINVAQIIKKIVTEINLPEKALKDRLLTLKLIDISWHNKRLMWYGYTFINSNKSTNYFINKDIADNMQNYFDSLNLKIDVRVHTHSGITYVALFTSGKNTRKQKYVSATYLALFIGQKYFFSTRRYVSSDLLNAVIRCMGYMDSKRLKLTGRDLRSLSKLCWRKMEGALNSNIDNTLEYKDAVPNIKKTGIDFTQQKQRKKYSETCFGDNPATLELLVINAPSTPVIHKDIIKELPNENIHATWEFRSHNIPECLTKLIERRVLVTPLPYYISNLMVLGKNEITLDYNN